MYETQKLSGTAGGRIMGQELAAMKQVKETPRLIQQIERLEKTLAVCHHEAERVEYAALRLVGPRPSEAKDADAPIPVPECLDVRLAQLGRVAEALASRISASAACLDSAI